MISHFSGFFSGFYGVPLAGASLLNESIGEYLPAVVSVFMTDAVITVICLIQRIQNSAKQPYRCVTKEKLKTDRGPKEKGDLLL